MASTQKPGSAALADILPEEMIRHIELTAIYVDYDWNGRSKRNVLSDASDAVQDTTIRSEHQTLGLGLKGLRNNLRNKGQDQPVILRRIEGGKSLGGKKTDKPYELIAGFRRYTAIEQLLASAEDRELMKVTGQKTMVPNTADGTILAVIRILSPLEARLLNGRENTERQNLSTQDMLGIVVRMTKELELTQEQISTELGVTQGYVSKLLKISKLPKAILAHWKGEAKLPGLPANVSAMLTSKDLLELQAMAEKGDPPMTEAQTVKRYIDMLAPPETGDETDTAADPVETKVKRAAELAAGLVKAGVLENGTLAWSTVIGPKKDGFLIDSGKADVAARAKYWDLAESAFKAAIDAKPATTTAAPNGAEQAAGK